MRDLFSPQSVGTRECRDTGESHYQSGNSIIEIDTND